MADESIPGALPLSTDNAFGEQNPSNKTVPALPQEQGDVSQTSKLDQILALVRQGKTDEAGKVVDAAAQERAAKPDDVPEVKEEATDTPEVRATGNKALDIAVSAFVAATGTTEADISKAMEAAYEAGDVKYIDKEYLKTRFGDKAEQAIALAEAVFEADTKAQQDLLDSVYTTAGGKEQFDACVTVFREHAKPAMVSVVRKMLDSGDPDAVREAASLISEFGKQSGAFVERDGSRQTAAAGVVPTQGLSADEFRAARQQLNPMARSYRSDMDRLIELRRLGKTLGK
ncbi:putative scaffolding protein [Pectobacterium phage PPWS1]|uniref:Scaffolding protein n=1 Tax=Pectobacterium phage PPWS1 TaxID=1685500 RepID=A0A0P0UVW9_9CAUD|nr:head scaffolding protein [Pectobacterium phage PPWS1]BAS69555.1 putative scaffolding protein [Pectobacterium phage PPWS1]